jgi:hypothetical protein
MDVHGDDSDLATAIYDSASPDTRARIQDKWRIIKAKRTREALERRSAREKQELDEKREKNQREQQDRICCQSFGKYVAFIGALCLFFAIVAFALGHGIADEYWVLFSWTSVIFFVLAAICYFDLRF